MCDSADRRGGSLAFAYAQYQLKSKRPIPKNWPFVDILGSPNWVRTSDLRINSPSLYRLSYRGIKEAKL